MNNVTIYAYYCYRIECLSLSKGKTRTSRFYKRRALALHHVSNCIYSICSYLWRHASWLSFLVTHTRMMNDREIVHVIVIDSGSIVVRKDVVRAKHIHAAERMTFPNDPREECFHKSRKRDFCLCVHTVVSCGVDRTAAVKYWGARRLRRRTSATCFTSVSFRQSMTCVFFRFLFFLFIQFS